MPNTPRSSQLSATSVELQLRPSRLLALAFAAVHLAAALPLFYLPLPIGIIILWLAALSLSLSRPLWRQRVISIRLLSDDKWRLTLPDGEIDADLLHWYAHPWLCVIVLRAGWRFRRSLTVPFWLVEPEVHRRLRVALRSSERGSGS